MDLNVLTYIEKDLKQLLDKIGSNGNGRHMNWRRRHSNRSSTTCHFVCFWAKISRAPASEYNNDFGTLLDVVVVSIRTISIYYYWNVVKLTHTHSPLCGSVGHSIWKGCNRTQPKRIHMSNISASLVRALSPLLHRTIVCVRVYSVITYFSAVWIPTPYNSKIELYMQCKSKQQ